ncbi:energy transducer TonB [Maricaulis sp.]|uniref:energy transducer TonB n=1 Tax=Maricaulis sp. TaxID=1486257 RepID=UPI0025C2F45C|nr:energy transducer TonB [Maricaulis sp.]
MTAMIQNLRTPIVLPVAAAITVGLFLLMRDLIAVPMVERVQEVETPRFSINEVPEDDLPDVRVQIVDIPAVEPPPPLERLPVDRAVPTDPGAGISHALPPVEPPVLNNRDGLTRVDGNPVPIVRIEPVYPAREAERGNSGSCTVIFDITPDGSTTNIRALSCDSGAFERATVTAVSRWRYNPQVENGQPVLFQGATTRLDYRLDG